MLEMPKLQKCEPGDRVAFFGPMVSGKTFCANALTDIEDENYHYVRVSFATKLKSIAKELYGVDGKNGNDRKILQNLGEYLRAIDPDVWIKHLLHTVEFYENVSNFGMLLEENYKIKIALDDLRYTNEAKVLRDNGFLLIQVSVPEKERQQRLASLYPETPVSAYYHGSEKEWMDISYDGIVYSSESAAPVIEQIDKILERCKATYG